MSTMTDEIQPNTLTLEDATKRRTELLDMIDRFRTQLAMFEHEVSFLNGAISVMMSLNGHNQNEEA